MSLGKVIPVGLPVDERKLMSPPHWMPTSREKLLVASTMRASTSTCGVCVSSERMSCSIWFSDPATSRMISMFVRSSTESVPRGVSSSRARGATSLPCA